MKQREIKFRAWDGSRWVTDDFYVQNGKAYTFEDDGGCNDPECCGGGSYYMKEQDGWKICQFTGLKDKSGKKIFEGDIVRVGEFDGDLDASVHEVKWFGDDGYPGFDLTKWGGECNALSEISQGTCFQCEVIGNIYQNAALLKEKGRKNNK